MPGTMKKISIMIKLTKTNWPVDRCSLVMERFGILSVNKNKLSGRGQIKVTYFKAPPLEELVDKTDLPPLSFAGRHRDKAQLQNKQFLRK